MKISLLFAIICLSVFISTNLFAQNVMINVLTQNAGVVKKNETVFFEVTINNTSPTKKVPSFKLKPQISFPTTIVEVPNEGHILPKGWLVISNKNGVVTLTNGTDEIAENETRVLLIAIRGKVKGGPSTMIGNLTFSNGTAPGSVTGSSLTDDNVGDNNSTSTIIVER